MVIAFIIFVLLAVGALILMYRYIRKMEIENARQERLQAEIRQIKEKEMINKELDNLQEELK